MIAKVYEVINNEYDDLLANTLANRYRYVLVDEFQDTDEMQWSILENLSCQNMHGRMVIGFI